MPKIRLNGVNYTYDRRGDGPPLLLLHGFTGSAEHWSPHRDSFAARYTTLVIDLLGHGATESPTDPNRYRIEHAAQDLAALLTALSASRAHIVGYSMGGRLALYFALTYPAAVRSLVLESASPGLADPGERAQRAAADAQRADRIERAGIVAFVDDWERLPLFASQARLPSATRDRLRAQRLRNSPSGLANSLRGMSTGVQPSLWNRLGALERPVLLLTGALDPKFVAIAQRMYAVLPHARHITVPDAGHTIHLEQPDAFSQHVRDFLR
ncbi:MAG: 2-succinyl-6-hydroxy-2,4-cyclohexadiene-1-carboxylate synthase [Chloroflexi bacterium]|nr:2-succinyl-6-hydroxy-2,4-cyclohexadiene-1-carboxylate synthase [Chloroflexota bacterium]